MATSESLRAAGSGSTDPYHGAMHDGVADSHSHDHDHDHDHAHDEFVVPPDLGMMSFDAFGVPIAVSAPEDVVPRLHTVLPPGATVRDPMEGDNHFILAPRPRLGYRLTHGPESFPAGADLKVALEVLAQVIREQVAQHAPNHTFVHAGVVGHNGRAILMPGLSFSGKTTLVSELVKAGATYYSDEYAVLDDDGLVHPYAKPLAIRNGGYAQTEHDVAAFGGTQGVDPLPVGLVAMCWYERGATWTPRQMSAGEAVLAVLGNTFSASDHPDQALPAVKKSVADAVALEGTRGEAADTARELLGPGRLGPHQERMNNNEFAAETVILSALLTSGVLALLLHRLRRTRPEFSIGFPLGVGLGIRLLAIAGVASTGLQAALRGGDESTFLTYARFLAKDPFGHGYYPHGKYPLHVITFATEIKFGDFSEGAMRITQVGIALLGVVLILAAVHDLAGGRAARIAAWVFAFEPASIFFNSALHKEPLMVLASGLMVFGGSKVWRRLDLSGLVLMAAGGWIGVTTRPYAGWFLISAGALILLHAGLRRLDKPLKAMPLVYAVIIAGFVATPAILQVTSKKSLSTLQESQRANSEAVGTKGNNLALESVDYSTRGKVFANLPKRVRDILIRPYPWQVSNASQQLGAVGSLFALTCFLLIILAAIRRRGEVLALTGPILYPAFFLLMAYSLSAGNAGTGFRYRTHIVLLAVAALFALREGVVPARQPVPQPAAPPPRPEPERSLAAVQ